MTNPFPDHILKLVAAEKEQVKKFEAAEAEYHRQEKLLIKMDKELDNAIYAHYNAAQDAQYILGGTWGEDGLDGSIATLLGIIPDWDDPDTLCVELNIEGEEAVFYQEVALFFSQSTRI